MNLLKKTILAIPLVIFMTFTPQAKALDACGLLAGAMATWLTTPGTPHARTAASITYLAGITSYHYGSEACSSIRNYIQSQMTPPQYGEEVWQQLAEAWCPTLDCAAVNPFPDLPIGCMMTVRPQDCINPFIDWTQPFSANDFINASYFLNGSIDFGYWAWNELGHFLTTGGGSGSYTIEP